MPLPILVEYPSAHALWEDYYAHVADIFITKSRGRKPHSSVKELIATAGISIGVVTRGKELILKQEVSLLLHVQEQMKETTRLLMSLVNERTKQDIEDSLLY